MAGPSSTVDQNLLPVQAYFDVYGNFQTFIGQGQPFFAIINPYQTGLHITNSTIDSTTIGATTPSTGSFTNMTTITGQVTSTPVNPNDLTNKSYVDAVIQGLSFKAPAQVTTTTNITLSGLQTIDGYTTLVGDRVLVKNQTTTQDNGIYNASTTAWTRSSDANTYNELVAAFLFVDNGTVYKGSAWVSTIPEGGTLGVTPITFTQFANTALYNAGTGLTLSAYTFSITPVGTAGIYGSASSVPVITTNASGQVSAVTNTSIAIAGSQITSGTIGTSYLSGSYTGITGVGTLTAGTWNASTIGVGYGGTGATTFTAGYLKASGTLAFSTVSTIPNTDITGLGTMSTQNANAVAITGGSISGLSSAIPVGSGGTGAISLTGYIIGNGTAAFTASTTIPTTNLSGTVTNAQLANSSITINGNLVSLGGTTTVTSNTTNALTIGTGLSGTSFNGSSAVTIANTGVLSFSAGTTGLSPSTATTGAVTLSGLLALSNGGTNANLTASNGGVIYSTASAFAVSSAGTTGQFLQSNGAGAPTWATPVSYATVTDDTTTATTRYPLFANQTSGSLSTEYTSSTKLQYVPSTGVLTATGFSGSGASLTSLTAGNLSGTIPSAVLGNSTVYIGTTAVLLNRASASISLTGTSIDGSAGSATTATTATNAINTAITDDTTTATTCYPNWTTSTTGNLPQKTASTKLSFVPNTGVLSATSYAGSGASLIFGTGTLSLAGNLTYSGAFTQTFTATANTSLTLPISGTLISTVTNMAANPVTGTPSASNFLRGDGTWATPGGVGTVTSVGQTFTGGLISVSGSPITTTGTLALTVAGTSGGIPYFSSATTWATSAALTANAVMIGGGAGVAPSTIATGTSGNALISAGAGAPTFGNLALGVANTNVSGALTVTNGGTGVATLTGLAYGNGTSAFTAATAAQALTLIGTVPIANGGTNSTATPTAGGVVYGTGTAYAINSAGTAGQKLISGVAGAPTWGSSVTAGTAVASTSGTSIDFTGIPSWAKRVTVMLNGVSTSGTANVLVQLGSGSVTTSGYADFTAYIATTTGSSFNSTNGFNLNGVAAASLTSGTFTLTTLGSNIWIATKNAGSSSNACYGGGGITLAGVLDRVRITTGNGTDTFDAGSINIMYE